MAISTPRTSAMDRSSPFGLTQRLVEHQTDRESGLDGKRRIDWLTASPSGGWCTPRSDRLVSSRVEDWRAGLVKSLRPYHVSSPLHVARSMRVSRTARPHLLRVEAYGTYPARATFDPSYCTR